MLFYSSFPSLSLTHHLSFLPIHLLTLTCPINNSTPSILLLFYSFLSSLNLLSMSSARHPVAVDVGCSCGRRKPSSLFSSSSHTKSNKTSNSSSTTTSSSELTPPPPPPPPPPSIVLNEGKTDSRSSSTMKRKKKKKKKNKNKKEEEGRVALESIAVAVESSEPYEDFRESMVQMVVEKEIYAWDDLNDLLHQFLSLNSPRHHKLILHAFADLWNSLFSPPSPCL